MIGAIAGDVFGSVYEGFPIKTTDFPLFDPRCTFTDDTVLTVAIAYAILHDEAYDVALKSFGQRYPHAGYGASFRQWIFSPESKPYNSWGNGSAMRVSPVGFDFDSVEAIVTEARRTDEVTHNHPEGIKGAQATALAVFLARQGSSKEEIRTAVSARFGYDLERRLDEIRPDYWFDISCQGSVPESIIAFLEAGGVEAAIRNAISLGGDADTLACIAGGVALAYFQTVPEEITAVVRQKLPAEFLEILDEFNTRFGVQ